MVIGLTHIHCFSDMKGNIKIRIVAFILLIVWMSVIFIMSAQPANKSSKVSGGFVCKIIDVLYSDFEIFSAERQSNITYTITFLVRKTAHFLEYFILGILSVITAFTYKKNKLFFKIFGAVMFSILYAVSDEVHQYFVPGRACRLLDICIDSAGSICAVLLVVFIISAKNRNKSGELNA